MIATCLLSCIPPEHTGDASGVPTPPEHMGDASGVPTPPFLGHVFPPLLIGGHVQG